MEIVNYGLALVLLLVSFGAVNKMEIGRTRPCVAIGMFLVLIGATAYVLSAFFYGWGSYAYSALLGGMSSLILAEQREASWFAERWASPLSFLIAVFSFVVFMAGLFSA